MNEEEIGLRIQRLRELKKLSQETVSERAKIANRTLQRIEEGKGNPTLSSIVGIAEALDCKLADLIGENATPMSELISVLSAYEMAEPGKRKIVRQTLGIESIGSPHSEAAARKLR